MVLLKVNFVIVFFLSAFSCVLAAVCKTHTHTLSVHIAQDLSNEQALCLLFLFCFKLLFYFSSFVFSWKERKKKCTEKLKKKKLLVVQSIASVWSRLSILKNTLRVLINVLWINLCISLCVVKISSFQHLTVSLRKGKKRERMKKILCEDHK